MILLDGYDRPAFARHPLEPLLFFCNATTSSATPQQFSGLESLHGFALRAVDIKYSVHSNEFEGLIYLV